MDPNTAVEYDSSILIHVGGPLSRITRRRQSLDRVLFKWSDAIVGTVQKSKAIDIIRELAGDEHQWADFKEDYYVTGTAHHKSEFIKDIAGLANVQSDQEEHYIFVGVTDEGDLVGISEGDIMDEEEKDGEENNPTHIFSLDESDIQQIIDSNLSPTPEFSWHTYEHQGSRFGAIVITPLSNPPCVTNYNIKQDSVKKLQKGLIFVRKGSSTEVCTHEDLERFIEHRIENSRERILESISKAVELGPEVIDQMSSALSTEEGVPIHNDPDASVGVAQQFTRNAPETGDEELNSDISLWRIRDSYRLSRQPLWDYYARKSQLDLDEEAIEFLVKSCLNVQMTGMYWIIEIEGHQIIDVLKRTRDTYHNRQLAAKILFIMDDRSGLEEIIEDSSSIDLESDAEVNRYYEGVESSAGRRVNSLLENQTYNLEDGGISVRVDLHDAGEQEILDVIEEVSVGLSTLQGFVDRNGTRVYPRDEFKDALGDLEIALGREVYR